MSENKCLKCGECCRWITIPTVKLRKIDISFYKTRGCKHFRHQGRDWVRIPSPCPNLEGNLCSIYNLRPLSCSVQPKAGTPKIFYHKNCGYL